MGNPTIGPILFLVEAYQVSLPSTPLYKSVVAFAS